MTLQCNLCRQIVIPLPGENPDDLGTITRGHLIAAHSEPPFELIQHMQRVSWILDLLAFDSTDDPAGYRELIAQGINSLLAPQNLVEVVPS